MNGPALVAHCVLVSIVAITASLLVTSLSIVVFPVSVVVAPVVIVARPVVAASAVSTLPAIRGVKLLPRYSAIKPEGRPEIPATKAFLVPQPSRHMLFPINDALVITWRIVVSVSRTLCLGHLAGAEQ